MAMQQAGDFEQAGFDRTCSKWWSVVDQTVHAISQKIGNLACNFYFYTKQRPFVNLETEYNWLTVRFELLRPMILKVLLRKISLIR